MTTVVDWHSKLAYDPCRPVVKHPASAPIASSCDHQVYNG